MKRYTPPYVDWMEEGKMVEREDGKYVKYEDVEKIVRKILESHTTFSHIISKEDIEKYVERN